MMNVVCFVVIANFTRAGVILTSMEFLLLYEKRFVFLMVIKHSVLMVIKHSELKLYQ